MSDVPLRAGVCGPGFHTRFRFEKFTKMTPSVRVLFVLFLLGTANLPAAELPDGAIERERLILYQDVPYVTGGGERQQLDLYLPKIDGKIPTNPIPVIVWIHWGSWMHGSKDPCIPLGLKYHQKGYALASINYRLIETDPFPAQLEDCKSAGGHLAALVGTTGHTKEFDVGEHLDQSSAVQCVCDLYGPADLPSLLEDPRLEGFLKDEQASPFDRLFLGAYFS